MGPKFAPHPPERGDSKEELNMEKKHMETRTLTGLAVFTAIVIVLAALAIGYNWHSQCDVSGWKDIRVPER